MGEAARILTQSEIDEIVKQAGDANAIPKPEKEDISICIYCKRVVHFKGIKIMMDTKKTTEVPYILSGRKKYCKNVTGHLFISRPKLELLKKQAQKY